MKKNTSVAAVDEEADATEDVSKKRARTSTTKPADLELGSTLRNSSLDSRARAPEVSRTRGTKEPPSFDAHLIVPPVLETHPHLGSTKRTTGMGQKTRRGRVADSHIREDQLIVEIHGEIRTRPVTIQTGFVLRNKSTREHKTMEEQHNGVVANSNSTATPITETKAREMSTTNT